MPHFPGGGQRLPVVGSSDPVESERGLDGIEVADRRTIAPNEDPVCGMTVDVEQARARGLATTHEERAYVFCGKGCFLDFGDDPEHFLAADYAPEM